MEEKVTRANIDNLVAYLNKITGSPPEPYIRTAGKNIPQENCYVIEGASGRVKLERICRGGGVKKVNGGYVTRREIFNILRCMIAAIEDN